MSQNEVKIVGQDDVQGMKASGDTHSMSIATVIGATIGVIGLILLLYGHLILAVVMALTLISGGVY